MIKKLVLLALMVLVVGMSVTACRGSDQTNTITLPPHFRTITLYSDSGKVIGQWHGFFSVRAVGGVIVITPGKGEEQSETIISGTVVIIENEKDY